MVGGIFSGLFIVMDLFREEDWQGSGLASWNVGKLCSLLGHRLHIVSWKPHGSMLPTCPRMTRTSVFLAR